MPPPVQRLTRKPSRENREKYPATSAVITLREGTSYR